MCVWVCVCRCVCVYVCDIIDMPMALCSRCQSEGVREVLG